MEGYKDSHVHYELLGKFLSGECTAEETALVEEWLAVSPDNPGVLEALRELWEQAPASRVEQEVDVDAAWHLVQSRMRQREDLRLRKMVRRSPAMWFIRIAATLFVVVCVGLVLVLNRFNRMPETQVMVVESGMGTQTDTLPDGTVVTLNAHSRLEYPQQFARDERRVQLKGEAYFEVAHDPAHPFRIQAGGAEVRVLGTTFNLNARGDLVKVAVQTGRVELSLRDSMAGQPRQRLLLAAGMAGTYDAQSHTLQPSQGEVENDLYWKTGQLVFRNQPLALVVQQLNATLGDSIVIGSEAIRDCPLSTTFDHPSIASALDVIKATFNLEVIHDEKQYTITGMGCN